MNGTSSPVGDESHFGAPLRRLGERPDLRIIDRCNLTVGAQCEIFRMLGAILGFGSEVLLEPGQESLPGLFS